MFRICANLAALTQPTEVEENLSSSGREATLPDQSSFRRSSRFGRARIFLKYSKISLIVPLLGWLVLIGPDRLLAGGQTGQQNQQGQAEDADPPMIPPARTTYLGRRIAQTMHYAGAPWLIRESREREEDCSKMLKALKVRPGQTVCDLGCGNGFYTLQMAKMVGEKGKVLAVDIQPQMLSKLKARAEDQEQKPGELLDRIKLILGSVIDPHLPEGQVDTVLLVDVYHEFSHPQLMLQQIRKCLKPKGRVVLVEFRLEDPNVPIKLLHKMSKKQVNKELTANGFKLAEEYDELPWQHMMFFQRDESWTPRKKDP